MIYRYRYQTSSIICIWEGGSGVLVTWGDVCNIVNIVSSSAKILKKSQPEDEAPSIQHFGVIRPEVTCKSHLSTRQELFCSKFWLRIAWCYNVPSYACSCKLASWPARWQLQPSLLPSLKAYFLLHPYSLWVLASRSASMAMLYFVSSACKPTSTCIWRLKNEQEGLSAKFASAFVSSPDIW